MPTDWLNAWATNAVARAFPPRHSTGADGPERDDLHDTQREEAERGAGDGESHGQSVVRPQHRHDGAGWKHAQLMSKRHEGGREERQPQRERPETEPPAAWDRHG